MKRRVAHPMTGQRGDIVNHFVRQLPDSPKHDGYRLFLMLGVLVYRSLNCTHIEMHETQNHPLLGRFEIWQSKATCYRHT